MKRIYFAAMSEEVLINDLDESEHNSFLEGAAFASGCESVIYIGKKEDGAFAICQKLLENGMNSIGVVEELEELEWRISTEHIEYETILHDYTGEKLYIGLDGLAEHKVEVIEIKCDKELDITGEEIDLPNVEIGVVEDGQYD